MGIENSAGECLDISMRFVLAVLIGLISNGFSEIIEFSGTNLIELNIPVGQSVQINSAAKKGPFEFSTKVITENPDFSTSTHYIPASGMVNGYFNGPSVITVDPLNPALNPQDIANSGLLISYKRISNQPYNTFFARSGTTNSLEVPTGKKLILINRPAFGLTPDAVFIYRGYSTNVLREGMIAAAWPKAGFECEGPETITIVQGVFWGGFGAPSYSYYFNYQIVDSNSSGDVDEALVTSVAGKIISTSNNYGLATKTELTNALTQSRTDGINSVLSNPNLWTLYTTSQIQGMAIGDLVLTRTNEGEFVLNYDIEQSEDLVNWTPYQGFAMPLTNLPTNKAFVRIKAKQ